MQKAHEYREVDLDYRIHLLAYLCFVATGKKKAGKNKEKPAYPSFKAFFDYEKAIKKVDQKMSKEGRRLIDAFRRTEGN